TCVDMDLNHARLPIPPRRLKNEIVTFNTTRGQVVLSVRCPWSVVRCSRCTTDDGPRTTDKKTAAADRLGRGGGVFKLRLGACYGLSTSRPLRVIRCIYTSLSIVSLTDSVCASP